MGILPKNGIRHLLNAIFLFACSPGLLFGTTYDSYHFHAKRSKVCACWEICVALPIDSPRANLCRNTASYASAPALVFSGLRMRYRLSARKSTYHDLFIFLTAILLLVD